MHSTADTVVRPPLASTAVAPRVRAESPRFYVWMAYACAAVAIVGFAPTYWAPLATGSFSGSPILHLHGWLFTAWTVLFIVQARLADRGRFAHHRALGLAGISLVTAMLFAGVIVIVEGLESSMALGFEPQVRAFSIVPFTIILFFVITVAVAIAYTSRPDVHMRLMLVATISLLPPAIARLFFLAAATGAARPGLGEPPPVAFSLAPSLASDLLLVVAILYDWRTRGRPHRTYVIAGALMLAVQIVRVPLSSTAAWHAVTNWLLTL